MEKKRIWLVSHYAMPPHLEVREKTIRMARILQERGHEVLLITASTIHNTDINLITDKQLFVEKEYDGLHYVHIRCSQYKGSGVKRILNLMQFQQRFGKAMKHFDTPDVIVADCNCVNYRGILRFAQKHKIPFVSEVRDLWPLSIVEYMHMSDKNPVIRYLYGQEKRMYKKSAAIIFSMAGGKDYIRDKGWGNVIDLNKVFYINNGIDVALQEQQAKTYQIPDDADLNDPNTFKVIYAGSIRSVNQIGKILDIAKELKKEQSSIRFLIYGDGDQRAELESRCQAEDITNVTFKGSVKKEYIPYICSKADVNIIHVQQSSLSKYGVSWNKLFDYMNAGKPILSTTAVAYDLIEQYQCGIVCKDQQVETMVNAVLALYHAEPQEYRQMCQNAKEGAKDFDYGVLASRLEETIDYACQK